MQIVTGRRGEPHVTSRQMQAVYRSFLGDFALLDIGEKLRAEAYSNDIVRVYDGVVSVQGIYAVIAYNQYDEVYIEPVSVGKKRIDTIVLHYTKDNTLDVEDMQLDVVQGEEYTDNPIAPVVPEGGDAWEGTTDIQVPIYDVEVTNFGLTVTPYARMLNLIPTLESIAERIPETVVTGVKGDSEVLYRDGDVNITKANIGLGNVDNTADTDKPISTATQTALNGKVDKTSVGANSGVAPLDSNGLVPTENLPSYVDDVLDGTAQNVTETAAGTYSATAFILTGEQSPCTPETDKVYVDTTNNIQYRWSGSVYVSIGVNLTLGETDKNAYRGDKGKTAYDHSQTTGNPHGTTKGDVGLGNVDNTSDLNKPISNAVNAKLIEAAESMKSLWDISTYADKTVNCSIGEPWDSYVAGQEYLGQKFLDVETGKIYDVVQSIPSGEYGFMESGQVNHISTSYNKTPVFGIHINDAESNPDRKVTYLADAVGMTPAHMNFTSGTFDYGSWEDVWFVRDTKPCLLKDNGQIHRYLNKNNFLKDIDGNDTGVPQITIHTMIEFPKIWYKVVPDIDGKGASIYISPVKVDADYVDYPYINYQGVHKEHFYMPAYNSSTQTESGTTYLCSTYGETVSKSLTAEQEIAYCKAHGNGWNTEDAGSIMLINFLLILMGKSTDVQSVFGQGLHTSGTEAINNGFTTGIHYNKGMFYGTNSGTIASNNYGNAVKVFGIENYWGFQWRRYAGDILVDGVRKIKLCYGNEDGSSTFDYNLTGNGYVNVGATPSGASGGYISEMKFTNTGMYSKVSSGSSSTHYCDGQWFNNSGTRYALRVGSSDDGALVGAFCVTLHSDASVAWWSYGAAPSYR